MIIYMHALYHYSLLYQQHYYKYVLIFYYSVYDSPISSSSHAWYSSERNKFASGCVQSPAEHIR